MVNSLGRFSAEPVSLTPSGTSLLQSPPSDDDVFYLFLQKQKIVWPPRNTSSDRSPTTLTMTMTLTAVDAAKKLDSLCKFLPDLVIFKVD
jgi:hypothetical protein